MTAQKVRSSEREKLIEELNKLKIHQSMSAKDELGKYATKEQLGDIADFVIADRRRIVEPLIITNEIVMRAENIGHYAKQKVLLSIAIDETLKLSGVDNG